MKYFDFNRNLLKNWKEGWRDGGKEERKDLLWKLYEEEEK